MKTQKKKSPHLGIDIGKVIMSPISGGKSDTSFLSGDLQGAMQTPPSPNVFEGVSALVEAFDGNVWLVSKAGANVQFKTKAWLRHWDFFAETRLPRTNVRFCLRRSEKAGHCKQLRLSHFIDDRLDVLQHLRPIAPHLYLFGEQPRLNDIPDWVTHVPNWRQTVEAVMSDIVGDARV
jgi:hypothetical protein